MKSLAELEQIRKQTLERVSLRKDHDDQIRVVIGMATCGIAAGARPVMHAFMDEIGRRGIMNTTVSQTGCIGMCRLEPMVDVFMPGQEKVTYVRVTPERVGKIVAEHLVNGHVVADYTIGAAQAEQE